MICDIVCLRNVHFFFSQKVVLLLMGTKLCFPAINKLIYDAHCKVHCSGVINELRFPAHYLFPLNFDPWIPNLITVSLTQFEGKQKPCLQLYNLDLSLNKILTF